MGGQKKKAAGEVVLFLAFGGTAPIDVYDTFDFGTAIETSPEQDLVWSTVTSKLDEYFEPKGNEIQARYAFRCSTQGAS